MCCRFACMLIRQLTLTPLPPQFTAIATYFDSMMVLELSDIMFFIRSIKNPTTSFDITKFINFSSNSTRSSSHFKLKHIRSSNNLTRNFYFNRLPRLWNNVPPININHSTSTILNHVSGHSFSIILILTVHVLTIIIVPVTNAYPPLYTHFIID